jgi:steroid 5-alpha reductase family enzyme
VTTTGALLESAITIAALMVLTWFVSVAVKNASIVDLVWGLGFVLSAWTVRLLGDSNTQRQALLLAMVTIWGLRLSAYLTWRNHDQPEDFRYRAMRKRWGGRFGVVSLVTVFLLQGGLMWVVSLPVQLGQVRDEPNPGWLALAGGVVWLIGMLFESVGDFQLARFKGNPANAGKVMDRGVWQYTRHPNYFGDACVWWGIGLVAADTRLGAIGLIGPLVMTVLLLKVSGVALLERSLHKRKPGYAEYAARTSAFIPMPPKR